MKKIRLCVIILTMIMVGICGCGSSGRTEGRNARNNRIVYEMKKHLEKRYGYIDYDIVGLINSGWDYPYDQLNLSTTFEGVEEAFFVRRYEEDGEVTYEDSYLGLLIRDDFEKLIEEYAIKYFPEHKIYALGLSDSVYPDRFNANSGIDEIISADDNDMGYMIFVVYIRESSFENENDFARVAQEFINEWVTVAPRSRPRMIYITDEDYDSLQRESCYDFLVHNIMECTRVY